MKFQQFKNMLQENFEKITQDTTHLFEVELDKDELWNIYLDSYPEGTNEIFRERRVHDCSCCRQFVKGIGNAVTIKDNEVTSVWDFETGDSTYQPVIDALSKFVKSKVVTNTWTTKLPNVGSKRNYEKLESGKILEWDHFYLELPHKFLNKTDSSDAEVKGGLRDTRNVFKRSLDEITEDSLLTILELIAQKSLYKGEEWQGVLNEFLKHKKAYTKLNSQEEKENYTWEQSIKVGGAVGRIRNNSIGTLLVNLSEGMELDLAVRKYEQITAPENYRRSKPIFTKKMLEEAQTKIQELGYIDSLERRFATLDDITVNNILFSNKDSAKRISGANIFDEMASEVAINPKKFSKVEEISVEDFMENVLPNANELEVFLENKHSSNMVSLIAPKNKEAASMFKWDNAYSWAYSGNITDSSMKDRVKSAGGNVEGVLRFSIQWNDDERDANDLDAHCIEPDGNEIYYGRKSSYSTGGRLDVDIQHPKQGEPAVENIIWADTRRIDRGVYKFIVKNFANRGGRSGFKAEIEFDGQIFSLEYNKELRNKEEVLVAEVTFDGYEFSVKEKLPSTTATKEVWGLKTNQFVPVSVVSNAPNYWDKQRGIGHNHYFFMLKDCVNSESPNGFYNEFLKEDLLKHKRVFEALGAKMRVEDVADQLSGVGFSSTKRNDVLIRVKGSTARTLRVRV